MKMKRRVLSCVAVVTLALALLVTNGLSVFASEPESLISANSAAVDQGVQDTATTDVAGQESAAQPQQPAATPQNGPAEPASQNNNPDPVDPGGEEVYWTVTFRDGEDFESAVIGEPQLVRDGEDAIAPASPYHEGYTFTGWLPEDLTGIVEDTTFVAQYEKLVQFTVTIRYVIDDESVDPNLVPAAKTVDVLPSSSEVITVVSPAISGYHPDREVVEIVPAEITQDVTITVTYDRSTLLPYAVKHFLADINEPDNPDKAKLADTDTGYGQVGELITAVARTYEGFTPPATMPKGQIPANAEEEPFELHVYYTRNTVTLRFVSEEDGEEKELHTIQLPYQSPITQNELPQNPSRVGYTFDGWILNGEEAEIPSTMPVEGLTFEAKWKAFTEAKVVVEYLLQNADNWDTYEKIGTYTIDSEVGAAPVIIVTDEAKALKVNPEYRPNDWNSFFTLNKAKTHEANADVLVKGDGTTVAKVYIDRKTFQFKFRLSPVAEQDSFGNRLKYDNTFVITCKNGTHASDTEVCFEGKLGQDVTDKMAGVQPEPTDATSAAQRLLKFGGWRIMSSKPDEKYGTGIGIPDTFIIGTNWLRNAKEYCPSGIYYVDASPKADPISIVVPGKSYTEQLDGTLKVSNFSRLVYLTGPRYTDASKTMIIGWSGYGSWRVNPVAGFTAYYNPDKSQEMMWTNVWMDRFELQTPLSAEEFARLAAEHNELKASGSTQQSELERLVLGQRSLPKWSHLFPNPQYQSRYFMRNSYTVTLNNVANVTDRVVMKYQQNLLSGLGDYVPESPAGPGYEFVGWYKDAGLTKPLGSKETLPAGSLSLYAKWKVRQVTVAFSLDGGTYNNGYAAPASQTVNYGKTVKEPIGVFAKEGYTFDGWVVNDTNSKFSFSTIVTDNMELRVKWKPRADIGYTTEYIVVGEDEPFEVVKEDDGVMGSTVTQYAIFYKEGYFPDRLSKWRRLGHIEADNVIVFEYTKLDSVGYTVVCTDTRGNVLSQENKASTKVNITENAPAIAGYTPKKGQETLMLTSDAGQNVIRFVYYENLPAVYKVVHYQQKDDQSGYEAVASENGSARVGLTVEAQPNSYDGFTYNASISRSWDTVKADGSTELQLYYDRIPAPSSSSSVPPSPSSTAPGPSPVDPDSSSSTAPPSSGPVPPSSSSSRPVSSDSSGSSSPVVGPSDGGNVDGGGTPSDNVVQDPAVDGTRASADLAAELPPLVGLNQEETAMAQRQTGNPITDILDGNVPMGGLGVTGSWSFASLLFALISLAAAIMSGITSLVHRKKIRGQKAIVTALAVLGVVSGLLAPVLWLALDNLNTPMTWINQTTPLIGLMTVLGIAATLLGRAIARANRPNDDDPNHKVPSVIENTVK